MSGALLGALLGGFIALTAGFSIELRRDRRRRIAAARLVLAEFRRAAIEILVQRDTARVRAPSDPTEMSEAEQRGWVEGPHPKISGDAWLAHAAEFVGALKAHDFEVVDSAAADLRDAGEFGFTTEYGAGQLRAAIAAAEPILEPLAKPTWFDRHVWRL